METTGRRRAVQARSRETVDRILAEAGLAIAEQGPDLVTMSQIARRAGVALGTLYQYFPDKRGVVAALFARYADQVRDRLKPVLSAADSREDLINRLTRLTRQYFQQHRDDPSTRSLWAAIQLDPELQALDAADSVKNAGILFDLARPFYGDVDEARLRTACALAMQLCTDAARFALALPKPLGDLAPEVFGDMVGGYFAALEGDRSP